MAVAGRNDGDLVDIGQRRGQRPHDLRHVGDQFVDHRRLVAFLVSLGLYVHRLGFRFAFLQNDFGFGFALRANRGGGAFGFGDPALPFGGGQCFDPLAIDLGLLQDRRDQFLFTAQNFGFLHLHLVLFFHLPDLHGFGHHLLLHDVGLDVVGLVGLRLLLLGRLPGTAPS